MAALSYVREIDGMRAIAVLSVLLFHCGFSFSPGGFVGVDVFFVISGYLITRIIAAELNAGKFSLLDFYKKRIARIAPALYATVLITGPVFFLLYPPEKSQLLLKEIFSSLLSISNFYFFYNIDYFSDAAASPVLHTWSLAIEEQFYFALPITLAFFFKRGRSLTFWLILFLFFASFIASIAITPNNRLAGFYLPWNRAWELMAGSLVALAPPNPMRPAAKQFCISLGLAIIAGSVFLLDKKSSFPGVGAIPPVLGSVLCLVGAGNRGAASSLLANRATHFFGKISYSLYLIHWPIVCATLLLNILGSGAVKIGVVIASIGLAWLSWRFIETPLRAKLTSHPGHKVLTGFAFGTAGMFIAVSVMQFAGDQFWQRSPQAVLLTSYMNNHGIDYRSGTCFLYPALPQSVQFEPACLSIKGERPSILLIGDSHAANINDSLRKIAPAYQVLQATATGCKPVINSQGDPRCVALNEDVLQKWLPEHRKQINYVVIAARWEDGDLAKLDATLKYLDNVDIPVVVMGPHPEYYIQHPLVLAYEELTGQMLADHFIRRGQWKLDSRIKEMIEANHSRQTSYYSILDRVCPGGKCMKQAENSPLLSDRDHFTKNGADHAIQSLSKILTLPR